LVTKDTVVVRRDRKVWGNFCGKRGQRPRVSQAKIKCSSMIQMQKIARAQLRQSSSNEVQCRVFLSTRGRTSRDAHIPRSQFDIVGKMKDEQKRENMRTSCARAQWPRADWCPAPAPAPRPPEPV